MGENTELGNMLSAVDKVEDCQLGVNELAVFAPKTKTSDYEQGDASITHGTYIAWETEVNLGGPSTKKQQVQKPEQEVAMFYNSLQYTLYETGFPETVDRTSTPRRNMNKEQVVVAVLSTPYECIGMLLECGHQVSDSIHLIFSPSWVSKEPSKDHPGIYSMYVHKAITFHRGGFTYIDEFSPPRRVTYLVNFFTNAITHGLVDWASEMERNLDCQMSSSIPLCDMIHDKLWTRYLMSKVGIAVPETLAYKIESKRMVPNSDAIRVCVLGKCMKAENTDQVNADNPCVYIGKNFENGDVCEHAISVKQKIARFVDKSSVNGKRIVVKPSALELHDSIGVTIHQAGDLESITNAVEDVLVGGDAVLVETFVEIISPRPMVSGSQSAKISKATERLGFRVRSTVCRDFDGKPVTTSINCGLSSKDSSISRNNTVCQGLDSTLLAYGLTDPAVRCAVDRDIRRHGEDVMRILIEEEHKLDEEQRGGLGGYTDVIGVDFSVTNEDGNIAPVAIEMKSHDCSVNCQVVDFMYHLTQQCTTIDTQTSYQMRRSDKEYDRDTPQKQDSILGRSVRPWVRSMIQRSQDHVLHGKHILIIGAGGFCKGFIWTDAAALGVKVVLVESNPNHFAKEQVYKFINLDIEDHTQEHANAQEIVKILHNEGITVDGCLTFWEYYGPLAALCAELLKTKGSSYAAACIAKNKSYTQATIRARNADVAHFPITSLYSAASCHIASEADIDQACNIANFPAILKLEYASGAVGVNMCKNEDDVRKTYTALTNSLCAMESEYEIGLGFGNTMLLMEYLDGSEHDIDVVIFERKLVAAFVSDNGPTNYPSYTETVALMPSNLPSDKQAQLVMAAYQCCNKIGLSNGVYNVEMKMTSDGPKLIEINARMGGGHIRNWIKRLYGVDLMKCAMLISCGIKPYVPKLPPAEFLLGVNLILSEHGRILTNNNLRKVLGDLQASGDVIFMMMEDEAKLKLDAESTQYEQPYAQIAVKGRNVDECRQKLGKEAKSSGASTSVQAMRQLLSQRIRATRRPPYGHVTRTSRTGPLPVCTSRRPVTSLRKPISPTLARRDVDFPAILKLDYATGAVGVNMCKNEDDVRNKYTALTNSLHTMESEYEIGLNFGNTMLLMENLDGSEHNIDVVIFDRKLVAAFVNDDGLTNYPAYTGTCHNLAIIYSLTLNT
ncbi:carnosine synthase 1-like [Amphiura filiformis]|uniref:carnosine synthase 1-like n=1 Tax=Amphiura filiformis TaxID=82378 RepID=UPI003B20E535